MSVDPQILALIVRRTRQLKRVKYPPTQETIIEYVRERLDVTEDAVKDQIELAIKHGELKERGAMHGKNYISYTFPEGIVHTSPLAKSPSPGTGGKIIKKPLRPVIKSPPLKSPSSTILKSPGSAAARTPLKGPLKSPLKNDARPELVIDEGKDLSKHIKTALVRMERPYGSSIKVLTQYFESRFKVKIKVGKNEERDKVIHKALLKSAILGVRRGLLSKNERMFRVAPLHMHKPGPDGPVTEKLQNAFLTMKKEKERAKKPAQRNILCSFCMKPEAENRDGKPEPMLSCCTCGNSGHPSCLKWSDELTKKVRSLPSWECIECKWCSVCREAGNDSMLFCDSCDRGFHLECCEPALTKPPKGDWSCLLCLFERYDAEQMASYLETHKSSPQRRFSLFKPVKYQISPSTSKKTPKMKRKNYEEGGEEVEESSSEEDDLPLRSSSAEGASTNGGTGSGRKKGSRNGAEDSLATLARVVPGQLIDPLSKFFTPTNKRQSAVARKSFESLVALARERKHQKTNRQFADKLVKKSRKELNKQTINEKIKLQKKEQRKSVGGDETERTDDSLPEHCNSNDVDWFRKSEQEAKKAIGAAEEIVSAPDSGRYPPVIVFGRFQIQTWYSAPYPQEYAKLPKLWICEFCLQYAKSRGVLERHMVKCDLRNPPGDEIYRNGALSVFEVDGQTSKLYCQNLCLLAKLFLDHKTLYYDVEPFLFYVLTVNDQYGSHLAGYFSKEKHCAQKYNVSCIMILPTYQRTGYGRFLVSFSYLLSRQEKQPGTPERPLSELGRLAYQAYWRDQVLEYLVKNPDTPSLVIHDISQRTGMSPHDIAATMQELGLVRTASDGSERLVVVVDEGQLRDYRDRIAKKPPIATLEPSALRWTPPVSNQNSNGVPNLAPPPMHNEFIEHLKANPPVPEQQKKKRKRRRKMSPWRRQRQVTMAARKKRLLEQSKNEAKSGDEESEKSDLEDEGSENDGEEDGPAKKVLKRESRPRKRVERDGGKKDSSTSSSESGSENSDESEDEDEDEEGGPQNGDKKPDPDDDSGSNSGSSGGDSGSGEGGGGGGHNGGADGGGGGGSSSSSNHETGSQSGSSYTTASDSAAPPQKIEEPTAETGENVLKPDNQRLRRSTVAQMKAQPASTTSRTRQSAKSTPKPLDTKSKENDQSAAVNVPPVEVGPMETTGSNSDRLRRPSSSASSSTTSKMEGVIPGPEQAYVTISRPLPSTKETVRARRSGIKPHRVISVLQAEDPSFQLLHRKTGPVPRPGRVASVASMTLSTTSANFDTSGVSPLPSQGVVVSTAPVDNNNYVIDEFMVPAQSVPLANQAVPAPVQTSPSVQSKVEAAVATFRKEQKVLTELAPTASVGVCDVQMMPIMPISFFSNTDFVGDDEISLPPPPSATVAAIAQGGPGGSGNSSSSLIGGSSSEFTTLIAPKFATLKAPSPPKNKPQAQSGSNSTQHSIFNSSTTQQVSTSLGHNFGTVPAQSGNSNSSISSQFGHIPTHHQTSTSTSSYSPGPNLMQNFYQQHQTGGYGSSQPGAGFSSNQFQTTSNQHPASTSYSQPAQNSSYYNPFLMAPSNVVTGTNTNFDLAAAAASLMHSQNPFFAAATSSLKAQHPTVAPVPNPGATNNMFFYPPTSGGGSSVSSPQPASAPVYQALGGIHQHQPQIFGQYAPQNPGLMMPPQQQQFSTPNLHTKWL